MEVGAAVPSPPLGRLDGFSHRTEEPPSMIWIWSWNLVENRIINPGITDTELLSQVTVALIQFDPRAVLQPATRGIKGGGGFGGGRIHFEV